MKISDKRLKLPVNYDNLFSKKLQEKGINCWLRSKYNWLKKTDSKKESCPVFRGKYGCIDSECNVDYHFIYKSLDNKYFDVFWEEFSKHPKLCLPTRMIQVSKKERELLKSELTVHGVSNLRDQNIIFNQNFSKYGLLKFILFGLIFNKTLILFIIKGLLEKSTRKGVLATARYEANHRNVISTSIFTDCEATKTLCESLCIVLKENVSIRGMIQKINHDPFGFLLFSQIQVTEILIPNIFNLIYNIYKHIV